MRSPNEIGNMWPVCKDCRHIAQAHPENGEHICGELTHTNCPTCNTRQNISCQCRRYNGPTRAEFAVMIKATEEEIKLFNLKD